MLISKTNLGSGIPSLLRSVPIVPTPRPCDVSSATFSKMACVAMSARGGLQVLGTSNLMLSWYNFDGLAITVNLEQMGKLKSVDDKLNG